MTRPDMPISFSRSMASLARGGLKTQTRRLLWDRRGGPSKWVDLQPGMRLWVREDCVVRESISPEQPVARTVIYSDDPGFAAAVAGTKKAWNGDRHISARFMHRWASRTTLTVTSVRRHRLNGISDEDCLAEGVQDIGAGWFSPTPAIAATDPRAAFALLWNHLHGDHSWRENPEVVAIGFTAEARNIDQAPAASGIKSV